LIHHAGLEKEFALCNAASLLFRGGRVFPQGNAPHAGVSLKVNF
jgi:hypothetical protein